MRNNNVLAIIFSNMHDETLRDLTAVRSMGSIPIGGRYRLIDFTLSGLVNAGIGKVGMVSKSRNQSLVDHLGSGKAWGLSRKHEGLYFLPTFDTRDELYSGRVSALGEIRSFLRHSREEYVILTDCYLVGNIDFDRLIDAHIDSGMDISVGYTCGHWPALKHNLMLTVEESGRISDIRTNETELEDGCFGLGLYIMRRDLLIRVLSDAISHNQMDFERDILQKRCGELQIQGVEITERVWPIRSLNGYFETSMAFLQKEVRDSLFLPGRPIYTKVRDCTPAIYGLHSDVTDSLVADGAHIEGTVRNSIIFRDVLVERGAVVENSIVMQGSRICRDASIQATIVDKNVTIGAGRSLQGADSYPVYIAKGTEV